MKMRNVITIENEIETKLNLENTLVEKSESSTNLK